MNIWDIPKETSEQKFFCLVCNRSHHLCYACNYSTNLIDNNALQCCNICHKNKNDINNNGSWKNKILMTKNYKEIQYPSWIRGALITFFMCSNHLDKEESTSLPPEIWRYIYKLVRLNDVGREYPLHNNMHQYFNYCNSSNIKHSYCEMCRECHYMEDGNILSIINTYPTEISKKIIFLIWYSNNDRYNKIGSKYFKVYNEQPNQLPNVLGMNTNYSYRKFCEKTEIIIDENTDLEIVKFLNENDINTNNYSFDGTKVIYTNNVIEYIKTLHKF